MPVKPTVLQDRYRNRGTAYTLEERAKLGITGWLPAAVETLDEQARRAYSQLRLQPTDLQKYIYLNRRDRPQPGHRRQPRRRDRQRAAPQQPGLPGQPARALSKEAI